MASRDDSSTELQKALDTEVDIFFMALQRLGGSLGAPLQRFRYPHFFLKSGQHFNSRGAKLRQGRSEVLPFLYTFPKFVSKRSLLGTGIGWLSLKELELEVSSIVLEKPSVGTLGDLGGTASLKFPNQGLSGSCESVVTELEVLDFSGNTTSKTRVTVGFWNDGLLPQSRCLHFDEGRSRVFIGTKAGGSPAEKHGGLSCYDTSSGERIWHQHVSAGAVHLSPNGKQLLAVTAMGLAIVDSKTGEPKHRFRERDHGGAFTPLNTRWIDDRVASWMGGTDFIVVGGVEDSGAMTLQLREAKSGQMIWELPLDNPLYESPRSESNCCASPNRFIRSVTASPCGRLIAFVAGDLYLVDGGSGELIQVVAPRDSVHTWEGADFSADGNLLAVASHEMMLVFDCTKAKQGASGKPSSTQFLRRLSSFWLD